ncbi:MAG: endonuclease III [Legionellales bacterium RIFCSPHIGHO2_12_FULL_35_11]|nr:MAG: endonuclease III [Legionellales bacterium RIFCSPHIGHO2_12_FULL_35_11]
MNRENCHSIFAIFQQENPHPKTELHYENSFQLLIAVILSAQATDVSVNKCAKKLFSLANNPEEFLLLGVDGLKEYIKSIGLYNTKAENIIKTCQILLEKYQSKVPEIRADLESLPGVGRKTANVILNTAFGKPTIAVDTHIFRVANRTGLATGKTPLSVEHGLLQIIEEKYLKDAHHWLVLHGRYVCVARKPKCEICKIKKYCDYYAGL